MRDFYCANPRHAFAASDRFHDIILITLNLWYRRFSISQNLYSVSFYQRCDIIIFEGSFSVASIIDRSNFLHRFCISFLFSYFIVCFSYIFSTILLSKCLKLESSLLYIIYIKFMTTHLLLNARIQVYKFQLLNCSTLFLRFHEFFVSECRTCNARIYGHCRFYILQILGYRNYSAQISRSSIILFGR